MKAILVEDEAFSLQKFELICKEIDEINDLKCFINPLTALEYAEKTEIDVAFLDIEMPGMSGIELAQKLCALCPDVQIIFITCFEEYAVKAFGVGAIGYLLKPYSKEEVEREIKKVLRITKQQFHKKVVVKTFGHFDIFVNGKPLVFQSKKAKEFLAILIDHRGSTVTLDEAVCLLWENGDDVRSKINFRSVIHRLNKTLKEKHIEDIYGRNRGIYWIHVDKIDCDYYRFLEHNKEAVDTFIGEYMSDYSWAESTLGYLEKEKNNWSKRKE